MQLPSEIRKAIRLDYLPYVSGALPSLPESLLKTQRHQNLDCSCDLPLTS